MSKEKKRKVTNFQFGKIKIFLGAINNYYGDEIGMMDVESTLVNEKTVNGEVSEGESFCCRPN